MKKILISLIAMTALVSASTCDVGELNCTIKVVNKNANAFNMSNAIFELIKHRSCESEIRDEATDARIIKLEALVRSLQMKSTQNTRTTATSQPSIIMNDSMGSGY